MRHELTRITPPAPSDRRALALTLALTAAYAATSFAVLARGFPHEDAYILFKYAEDVARGAGIAFYPGGPHVEGATDFSWMLALAAGAALHVDPAVGAALLGTAAFFVCARLFVREIEPIDRRTAPLVLLAALLLLAPCAVASYLGFGTMAFATLALVTYGAYAKDRVLWIPPLALALGLLRPDGVLLGVAFVVLAIPRARAGGSFARYVAMVGACAVAGAVYVVWRWRYFHELLPLPFYVKSHHDGLPSGVEATVDWMASTLLPTAGVAVAARALLGRASSPRAAWLGLLPFALHAASFAMVEASQNVANRFEAPGALALSYFVTASAAARARANAPSLARTLGFAALALVAFFPQGTIAADVLAGAFEKQYANVFAWRLARIGGPEMRVASTEAGRVLYWTRGPTLDLIGLNDADTAHTPPSRALLSRFDPDVVSFHPAGTMDEDMMEAGRKGAVLPLSFPLAAYLRPGNAALTGPDLPPYDALHVSNVHAAPVATLAWLDTRADAYEVYAVRFKARFARFHVYAIRASWPHKGETLAALVETHRDDPGASHLALLRAR